MGTSALVTTHAGGEWGSMDGGQGRDADASGCGRRSVVYGALLSGVGMPSTTEECMVACDCVPQLVLTRQEIGVTTVGACGPGPCGALAEKVMYAAAVLKAEAGLVYRSSGLYTHAEHLFEQCQFPKVL